VVSGFVSAWIPRRHTQHQKYGLGPIIFVVWVCLVFVGGGSGGGGGEWFLWFLWFGSCGCVSGGCGGGVVVVVVDGKLYGAGGLEVI